MKKGPKTFESVYTAKINYIRKLYSDGLSSEHKKAVDRLEAICKDIWKNIKEMNLSAEEGLEIFHSTIQQLKGLKREIENTWKLKKTDYDAVRQRATRLALPILPIQEIIRINKATEPPKLEDLKNISFPILSYENMDLCRLASTILKQTTFAVEQHFSADIFEKLVVRICKSYNVVSYHNFSHAFSLFLMLYQSYGISPEFKDFVSNFELFCALIAAITHDSGHKGTNNLYEVKKNTERARKYSNQSVLQNMHISNLFRIFRENPDLDIVSCIKDPLLRERAKRILVNCVLATDMAKHNPSLEIFALKRKATEQFHKTPNRINQAQSFQKKRLEDRETILEYIVHSCDIGNPCLQFKNYMNWAALLAQEFDDQTKKEAQNGLQVTGFLKYVDKPTFFRGQQGFSKIFVLPLWKEISLLWPSFKIFSDQVESNIEELQKVLDGLATNP